MTNHFFRFKKIEVESLSMLKGENSWYRVSDAADEPVFFCHVVGNCMGGTNTFHASRADPEVLFRMQPRRRIMNMTYDVSHGADGPPLATIELFATRGVKVSDPGDRELYRVVDPQGKLDKFMQDVLDGCCTEYAIVAGDAIIGAFEPRERPEKSQPKRKGRIAKILNAIAGAVVRDWCAEISEEGHSVGDPRPLIAGLILLKEQSIRLDQSV